MKIFVAGSTGQLARALVDRAAAAGVEVLAVGRPALDLERRQGGDRIAAFAPDAIVNAAAYTAVDAAEGESALAFAINRDGAAWLAGIADKLETPFLHVSTDYVFDGAKTSAYTEDDPTDPQTAYGRTKRAGEEAVLATCPAALIFRTAWVYSPYGANFVRTMLRLARERNSLRVVDDQTGNPTSAHDMAAALLDVAKRAVQQRNLLGGIYHMAGTGDVTWCGFAQEIMRLAGELGHRSVPIAPIATVDYPTPARRPANSRLNCDRLQQDFGLRLPRWQESLAVTMKILLAK